MDAQHLSLYSGGLHGSTNRGGRSCSPETSPACPGTRSSESPDGCWCADANAVRFLGPGRLCALADVSTFGQWASSSVEHCRCERLSGHHPRRGLGRGHQVHGAVRD